MASVRHIWHQTGVVAALAETAMPALLWRLGLGAAPLGPFVAPGPEIVTVVPPRPAALSRDYVRHVGGDSRSYDGLVPPHLFPQWTMPTLARTLRGLPFPMLEAVNGGCRLELNGTLPAGAPLEVRARLESVEDDGRRAVLRQRVATGPAACPNALVAEVFVVVPSGRRDGAPPATRARKEPARVPAGARELAYWSLGGDAGLGFAMLTGDFNPVHWSRRYGRAFGHGGAILHGFSTMARAIEGLHRAVFAGAPDRLRVVDVRFTRALRLPARVGLYLDETRFFVGDAPGGPAYLVGSFIAAGAPAAAPLVFARALPVARSGRGPRRAEETRP
ncbi:MAG TPA: MaoC/PaaZ C-terminal domain-containing protein [Polyangia bacterium]